MGFTSRSAPSGWLFLRSVLPSTIGFMMYLLVAMFTLGGHLLVLSLSGKAFPMNINEVLLTGYTNYIVAPLTAAINSSYVNNGAWLLLWGALGFAAYEGIAFLVGQMEGWRTTKRSVMFPEANAISRRPARHYYIEGSFVVVLAWRVLIILATLAYTIGVVFVLRFCMTNNEEVLAAHSAMEVSKLLGVGLLCIVAIIHGYVILARWYLLRTRITGEILY